MTGQVLEILLNYLYTDKSAVITGNYNFVCLFVAWRPTENILCIFKTRRIGAIAVYCHCKSIDGYNVPTLLQNLQTGLLYCVGHGHYPSTFLTMVLGQVFCIKPHQWCNG